MLALNSLVQKVDAGAQLLRSWPLTGGVSARVTAIEIRRPGGEPEKLVVREYGARDLAANPQVAQQESAVLRALKAAGLPVSAPHYSEPGVLVTDFMAGDTAWPPADQAAAVRQMAVFLARLHSLPVAAFAVLRSHPPMGLRPPLPDESLSETRIREALAFLGPPPRPAPAVLHGDFWPGNLLWQEHRLAAVIDWEDATLGDPLADLGNARLELLFSLGPDAVQTLTREYARLTAADLTHLPFWDLRAALRPCGRLGGWGLEPQAEKRLRERHRAFVDTVLGAL